MWIKYKDKMFNTERISQINTSTKGNIMIQGVDCIEAMSQVGYPVVHYDCEREAEWVLERLFLAIKEGDEVFEFPNPADVDLDIAKRHTSHVTNRKASHGGS